MTNTDNITDNLIDLGNNLSNELGSLLRPDQVSSMPEVLTEHASDKWHASSLPDVVVFPESAEDVATVIKYASANHTPVYTRAAGSGHTGACVAVNKGILISMMRMNQILEINPSDGVAVVQPGVITGELQRAVREHGWYYPPDPASLKECTIGGNIATNAGGPRCLKYGVTKQYALGLETVLASGEILRSGGRCHKNSTGFDLTSLMVGSEGMLGIITEITVRLIPHPQTRVMLGASFTDFTGLPASPGLDGRSFLPLVRDAKTPGKTAAFCRGGNGRTVRTLRYRLTERTDGSVELYDHASDPLEYHSLAALPEHAATVKRLRGLLLAEMGPPPPFKK